MLYTRTPVQLGCCRPGCCWVLGSPPSYRMPLHFPSAVLPCRAGSGKERGHGRQLTACPRCYTKLRPGTHHVVCKNLTDPSLDPMAVRSRSMSALDQPFARWRLFASAPLPPSMTSAIGGGSGDAHDYVLAMTAPRWSQICFGGSEVPSETAHKGISCDRKTPSSPCAQWIPCLTG